VSGTSFPTFSTLTLFFRNGQRTDERFEYRNLLLLAAVEFTCSPTTFLFLYTKVVCKIT
jgi:hypothetical protein